MTQKKTESSVRTTWQRIASDYIRARLVFVSIWFQQQLKENFLQEKKKEQKEQRKIKKNRKRREHLPFCRFAFELIFAVDIWISVDFLQYANPKQIMWFPFECDFRFCSPLQIQVSFFFARKKKMKKERKRENGLRPLTELLVHICVCIQHHAFELSENSFDFLVNAVPLDSWTIRACVERQMKSNICNGFGQATNIVLYPKLSI